MSYENEKMKSALYSVGEEIENAKREIRRNNNLLTDMKRDIKAIFIMCMGVAFAFGFFIGMMVNVLK